MLTMMALFFLLITHVDEQPHCEDDLYLYEAAKEIIYAKFYASKGFLISIPQHLSCCDSSSCTFYNQEECVKDKHIPYDLKKHGYVECLKDYMFPNTAYSGDTRSPIPMISVHSVGDFLYRRQS